MYSTHQQHPPPPIPPSPTLSNPDMILPFDENERENSTPSPPFNLPSLSHLQSFYESRTNYANGHTVNLNSLEPTRNGGGALHRPQKKAFPRHTWMHEGHDAASRRLSDIGEEDTATSPARPDGSLRPSHSQLVSQRRDRATGSPVSLSRSETSDADTPEPRAYSSSSGSTNNSGASESSSGDGTRNRHDHVASPKDRVAGVGRQSTASAATTPILTANALPDNEDAGPEEDLSSAVLSNEAERILENAKRRLSLMEGNLTRARSSMRASPSLSPSPGPSMSPGLGQPVGGLYQSISRTDRRSSAMRPRQTYSSSSQDASGNRHSRVYSETNLPSLPSVEPNLSRSVSAMGSSSSSNFHTDERSFQYAANRAYLTHRSSVSGMQRPQISGSTPPAMNERASSDSPQLEPVTEQEKTGSRISNMDEFNTAYPAMDDPPSRSQSQMQVRDLQDQMKGLHIKISTLKVKAQEDNLRRRSLQSLRTPSPLADATQWYPSSLHPSEQRDGYLHPSAGYGQSPRNSEHTSSSNTDTTLQVQEKQRSDARSPTESASLPPSRPTGSDNDHNDRHSVVESLYEDAAESPHSDIDRQALEEILREPLDDDLDDDALGAFPLHPEATPHEEREDAFDYEHFILHSALGNYTQARLRRPSDASDTSVETTRPIQGRRSVRHSRSNSANSLSTVATFATAIEGHDIESVLYWDRVFNDEMRSNHQYPSQTPEQIVTTHHSLNRSTSQDSTRTPRHANAHTHQQIDNLRPDSSARGAPTPTGTATPTSLASSLVSTVRAATSPHPNTTLNGTANGNANLGINEDDTRLLEQLFKSLGDVCMELQALTTSPDYDVKLARVLRRRLEAARRVLDGELDA